MNEVILEEVHRFVERIKSARNGCKKEGVVKGLVERGEWNILANVVWEDNQSVKTVFARERMEALLTAILNFEEANFRYLKWDGEVKHLVYDLTVERRKILGLNPRLVDVEDGALVRVYCSQLPGFDHSPVCTCYH